jgi:hypothetical protein
MRHVRRAALGILLASAAFTTSAMRFHPTRVPESTIMHQVIAVYLGTVGTDAQSGMSTSSARADSSGRLAGARDTRRQ